MNLGLNPRGGRRLAGALLFGAGFAGAQETPAPPAAPAPRAEEPQAPPGLADLVPRARALADRRDRLAERLAVLGDLEPLEKEIPAARERLRALRERFDTLRAADTYGFDQVTEVKAGARLALENLGRAVEQGAQRLAEIEAARREWAEEKTRWQAWREDLKREASAEALEPTFAEARRAAGAAQKLLERADGPLVEFQRRIADEQAAGQALVAEAEILLQAMRGDLLRKSRPSLLSPRFYAQFDAGLWRDLRASLGSVTLPDRAFFAAQGWIAALQALAVLALGVGIRRHAQRFEGSPRWRFLLRRPFSAGCLAGVPAFLPLYGDVPALWRLVLWTAAGLGAARLAAGLVALRWRRRLIYLLAALFLVSQFLGLIGFPTPLFRLYVAGVGLGGAALCFWRARENERRSGATLYVHALRLGSVVLLAVFAAQVGGYSGLATHLLDASIKTTFLGLFAWMFALLANGAIEFLLARPLARRYALVREHGGAIQRRLATLVAGAVAVVALAAVLEVWRLYDTPAQALRGVLGFGVTLGETRVTAGLVLAAGALLYGALATSWLVQRVLDAEVYPRRHVESGVRISINRLIQYGFVLVGFLAGVSALGLELKNLTILAGAFGIGVGFGLQNIVNNFVSGLILLFERPIKVGDLVQLGDQWGTVEKLGLRATVVRTFDQSEVIVPNSTLISGSVTNWTLTDRHTRLVVLVGIAYGSDVPLAMKILQEVGAAHPQVLAEPAPQVLFMAFGASSLDFELRVWLADVDKRFPVRSDLHQAIDRRFREAGVEISFPQRDLHLRTVDEGAARALAAVAAAAPRGGVEPPGRP
ncbi:MAG: mechanosensitive ion channel family protein [Deferrisomatales bacterium]